MRVVIEQTHSLRREMCILSLVIVSGVITVVALLVPVLAG